SRPPRASVGAGYTIRSVESRDSDPGVGRGRPVGDDRRGRDVPAPGLGGRAVRRNGGGKVRGRLNRGGRPERPTNSTRRPGRDQGRDRSPHRPTPQAGEKG